LWLPYGVINDNNNNNNNNSALQQLSALTADTAEIEPFDASLF